MPPIKTKQKNNNTNYNFLPHINLKGLYRGDKQCKCNTPFLYITFLCTNIYLLCLSRYRHIVIFHNTSMYFTIQLAS